MKVKCNGYTQNRKRKSRLSMLTIFNNLSLHVPELKNKSPEPSRITMPTNSQLTGQVPQEWISNFLRSKSSIMHCPCEMGDNVLSTIKEAALGSRQNIHLLMECYLRTSRIKTKVFSLVLLICESAE